MKTAEPWRLFKSGAKERLVSVDRLSTAADFQLKHIHICHHIFEAEKQRWVRTIKSKDRGVWGKCGCGRHLRGNKNNTEDK